MTVGEQLQQMWNSLLELTSKFVLPDWNAIINALPLLLFIGLVGPLLTLAAIAWFVYYVRRPRAKVAREYGRRVAEIGPGGPIYPRGEPFCVRDNLVYPTGVDRCEVCLQPLSVECPKCGLVRSAGITTCKACGLVLKIQPRAIVAAPAAGPPPGGAAAA